MALPGGLQVPPRPLEFKSQPMPRQKRSGDERLGKRNRDLSCFEFFFNRQPPFWWFCCGGGSGFERGILLSSPEPPPKETPKSWQKRKSVTPEGGDGFDVAGRGENFETSA